MSPARRRIRPGSLSVGPNVVRNVFIDPVRLPPTVLDDPVAQFLTLGETLAHNSCGVGAIEDIHMDEQHHEDNGRSGRWTGSFLSERPLTFAQRPAGPKSPFAASAVRE